MAVPYQLTAVRLLSGQSSASGPEQPSLVNIKTKTTKASSCSQLHATAVQLNLR